MSTGYCHHRLKCTSFSINAKLAHRSKLANELHFRVYEMRNRLCKQATEKTSCTSISNAYAFILHNLICCYLFIYTFQLPINK